MSDFRDTYSSTFSPEEIWQAIKTPLSAETAPLVQPGFEVSYEDLSEEGQIQRGTRITYVPAGILNMVPEAARESVSAHDITWLVEEQAHGDRSRVDVLESTKAQGRIHRKVETAPDGTGLLVVEADLTLEGFYNMFKNKIIEYGISKPSQSTIENLLTILGS